MLNLKQLIGKINMTNVVIYSDTETDLLTRDTESGVQTNPDKREAVSDVDFLRFTASEYVMDGKRTEKSLRELFDTYVKVRRIEEDYAEFQHNFGSLAHLYDTMNDYIQTSQSEDQEPPSIFQAFIYLQEFGVGDLADKFAANVLSYHLYDNQDKDGISRYIIENPPEGYTEEVVYKEFRDRREIAKRKAEDEQRALGKAAKDAADARELALVLANTSRFL